MNVSKFLVLGTLGLQGESSGYDVVQFLRKTRVERWTDVKIGSIYYAIGKLQENGAIEEVRKERQGKQPEKTIYRITSEGEDRFKSMQEEAFQGLYPHFYGFKLALKFNVHRTADEIASFAETAIEQIDEYVEAMDSYLHSLDDAQRRERDAFFIDHDRRLFRAERDWIQDAVEHLDDLEPHRLPGSTGS
jgi:DNA-binding PadR family transcriptional regulator